MGASREGLGTWAPTPISWVLLWAGKGSVVLPVSGEGRVEGPTPDLTWPLGHQLRGWVPASFWRGQETARLSQRRELGPFLSCPPQFLVAPQGFPIFQSPQPFLSPSAPIDVRTQRHRRQKRTCPRHREVYYKNCTKEPSAGLAWACSTQTRCNGRGSAGGGGLDPVQPRWLCTQPSGESSVQQRLRLWGHTHPGPEEEEGKDVGRVLVREEADPWRNF